jgi:1,4-dihydroxy-2-naphthoate octaprenyltransferase
MARLDDIDPSFEALHGKEPVRRAARLLLATRPRFFAASVLPLLIGTAWGSRVTDHFDAIGFALALVAVMCVHAGANVLNDVCDDRSGSDRLNRTHIHPYTGGSRFIQVGIMSAAEMTRWGLALLALAVLPGAALLLAKGPGVLAFGLAGVALGVLYSARPAQLSARGLGEAAIGLAFGPLPVIGGAWVQTGTLDGDAALLSIPIALWVTAIILMNEVPDVAADAAAGKRTLAVRLGARGTRWLYLTLQAGAFLGVVLLVGLGLLPAAAVGLPLLLAIAGVTAARSIDSGDRAALKRAIEITLAIHAFGGLWLAGWLWLG